MSVSWKDLPLALDIIHESLDQVEHLQVYDCLQPTAGDHLCRRLLGHWAPSNVLSLNNHSDLMFFLLCVINNPHSENQSIKMQANLPRVLSQTKIAPPLIAKKLDSQLPCLISLYIFV